MFLVTDDYPSSFLKEIWGLVMSFLALKTDVTVKSSKRPNAINLLSYVDWQMVKILVLPSTHQCTCVHIYPYYTMK